MSQSELNISVTSFSPVNVPLIDDNHTLNTFHTIEIQQPKKIAYDKKFIDLCIVRLIENHASPQKHCDMIFY